MKIGLISDSHDHLTRIRAAVDIFNRENVELVLHCGDFIAPFAVRPFADLKMKIIACYGNNDGEKIHLQHTFENLNIEVHQRNHSISWQDKYIFMMHEPDFPDIFAASGKFDLVVYGHTHKSDIHKVNDVLVVNPGEACGWLTGTATIALVDLNQNQAKLVTLP